MACTADASRTCGGFYTIAVYDTGANGIPFSREQLASSRADEEERESSSKPRVAFLLVLNGRNVRQIYRLIRNIYAPEHFYYIHVDAVGQQSNSIL
jgi:protein xylosyltransferase